MNWSPDIYQKTLHYAAQFHKGQTYGGSEKGKTVEYMNHISCVAMETIWALTRTPEANADFAIQCALLHDTIEDTEATYEMIHDSFGRQVADGVQALTKNETLPSKKEQMMDSLARIQLQPKEVWMVKMADRITNLYSPAHYWNRDKIIYYHEEAILIYENLSAANKTLADRLLSMIETYKKYF